MERGFVYSHVLTTYYNWKNKVLLKDKLDEMDKLIAEHGEAIAEKLVTNEKFADTLAGYVTKAMMSNINVNDENKVPTSAFIHSLAQQITANQTAITALNADRKIEQIDKNENVKNVYRTFREALVGHPNTFKVFAFASSPSDNPFSFSGGYAISFHSDLLVVRDTYMVLGISSAGGTIEAKKLIY